jgi:DNA-directed RNA polymerase specialized sigma24 family protein
MVEADGGDAAARRAFERFVADHATRIWQAVVPIAGTDIAADATADALAHAWEHWTEILTMQNQAGYVFTVARTHAVRRARRRLRSVTGVDAAGAALPAPRPVELPEVEPGLAAALGELTEMQRQAVVLVEAFGWGLTDRRAPRAGDRRARRPAPPRRGRRLTDRLAGGKGIDDISGVERKP